MIAPSGALAWAYALWPFGVWAGVAGGVAGAVAGAFGAYPFARLADRASVDGGLRRWCAAGATLVALWLALVILPSVVGAVARDRLRPVPPSSPAVSE